MTDIYETKISKLRGKKRIIRGWDKRIRNTGLSRRTFAEMAGVNHSSLSRWINWHEEASDESVVRVELALRKLENPGV